MAHAIAGRPAARGRWIDPWQQNPPRRVERIRRRRRSSVEISNPAIPGYYNQWHPSRGEARKAALRYAARMGEGCSVVWHGGHAFGQQRHYHVVCPNNRRLNGHFFYGARLPKKAPPDDRYSRRRRRPRDLEADPFLGDITDFVDMDLINNIVSYWPAAKVYGRAAYDRIRREAHALLRRFGSQMTPQQAIQIATQSFRRTAMHPPTRTPGNQGKLTTAQVRQRQQRRLQRMSTDRRKLQPRRGY